MRVYVQWLPEAVADVERLHSFLYAKNPGAGAKAADAILAGVRLLAITPRIGRPMPDETGRRELFIPFGASSYVIRYMQQTANNIVVIRVWHGRETRLTEGDS